MGYRISWIGFEGLDRAACLALIGMRDTARVDEANEAPFSMANLPTGWTILFSNDFDYASDHRLAVCSNACRVIGCRIDETIMYSSATAFENGHALWSVCHDSGEGLMHLQARGESPKEFADIREKLIAEQEADGGAEADTDYVFEIPVELAAVSTGYRHDRWKFEWGEPEFTEVEPAVASGRN